MQARRIIVFTAILAALVIALGATTRNARAETVFMVNTPGDHNDGTCDANDCSLREAVRAAQLVSGGGVVRFDPNLNQYGEIEMDPTLGWLSLDPNTSVAVDGELNQDGVVLGQMTITANGTTAFRVQQGAQLDIRNLTITGAGASAISNTAGTVTVAHSTFSGNQSSYGHGGAIYNYQGSITVSDSSFSSNSANSNGGAISNQFGTANVTDSTFYGNSANIGGSLENWNGTMNVTNINVQFSTAVQTGGAINNSSGRLTVTHSGFLENSALDGGAIQNFGWNGSKLTVTDSTFSRNSAKDGGAILNTGNYPWNYSEVNITNSAFLSNNATGNGVFATEGGAGLNNYLGVVTVANSVFLNNNHDAPGGGMNGGIVSESGPTLVLDSTIAFNSGGGVWAGYFGNLTLKNSIVANNVGYDCGGPAGDGGYNLSSDTTCQFAPGYHSLVGVDPLFESNYSLLLRPNSPAIDAGDDTVCAAAPVNNLDFLGKARPRGPHCDMGAYEMPRASLVVINHVVNDEGGTNNASDFMMNVSGTSSASFPGAEAPGTLVGIAPGSYSVTESGPTGYNSSASGGCSGTLAENQSATCTFTNDDVAPPTPTPTLTPTPTDTPTNTPTPTVTPAPSFAFNGFFPPVDNLPTLNVAKAGSVIPVKFSLGGNQGMDILAEGYPASHETDCSSDALRDPIEETVSAGSNGLTYDATTDTYTYTWKTKQGWAGTCRKLVIQFSDGSVHKAVFKFK